MVKNYQNGKIYKIVCHNTNLVYIGSTVEPYLSRRLVQHKDAYKRYLKGKTNKISSFEVLEGNNYEIVLIENFPCKSVDELRMRERYFIDNQECVNYRKPCLSPSEIINRGKDYYHNNKEKEALRKAVFYQNNKERVDARNCEWNRNNKELRKQYYLNNKDKIIAHNSEYKRKRKLYLEQLKYYNI